MIARTFLNVTHRRPKLRTFFWKSLYEFLAGRFRNREWQFMNFGYAPQEHESEAMPTLPEEQAANKYCIQLYYHLASQVAVEGKDVLEVGSGRGGGANFIYQNLKPASMTGLDLAEKAVNFSNNNYQGDNLRYVQGSAIEMPFEDNSFDVVVNVESSHAYPSMEMFLSEVKRVLRPGGYLVTADNRHSDKVPVWHEQLENSGMSILAEKDITGNVQKALDDDNARKESLVQKHVPGPLRKYIREFAGMHGTVMYNDFASRRRIYKSYRLQKS